MGVNGILLAGSLLIHLRRSSRGSVLRSRLLRVSSLFFLYLLIVTFWFDQKLKAPGAVAQLDGLLGLMVWLSPAFALLLVAGRPVDLVAVVRTVNVGLLVMSASIYLSFLAHLAGLSFGERIEYVEGIERYFGPLGDQVAYVVVLGVLFGLLQRRWGRCLFHLTALLLTGTRGALITLAAGALVYSVTPYVSQRSSRWTGKYLPILVLVLMVAGGIATSVGQAALVRFLNPSALEAGISMRIASMQLGIEAFLLHPAFGVGFAGFTEVAYTLRAEALFETFLPSYVSNTCNQYIQVAADGGIIGLVLFASVIWALLSDSWDLRRVGAGETRGFFETVFIWILAILVGNQGAVWLLPNSLPSLYIFALGGLVSKLNLLWAPEREQEESLHTELARTLRR